MTRKRAALLLICWTVAGCAFGRTQDYLRSQPTLQYSSQVPLAVGVQDRRPYILNRDKGENFVGLQRGGYGNPFDVRTASGLPLAEDMTAVLARALARSGGRVTALKISPIMSWAEILRLCQAHHAEKALLLSLYEWKADTAARTRGLYDIEMEVFNTHGEVLAKKRAHGTDNLGGSFWAMDPQANAQTALPAAFQNKLKEMFEGEIAAALDQ
jgi:hypothetical protein